MTLARPRCAWHAQPRPSAATRLAVEVRIVSLIDQMRSTNRPHAAIHANGGIATLRSSFMVAISHTAAAVMGN